MQRKSFRLSQKTARELIYRVTGAKKIDGKEVAFDGESVAFYAHTGSLEIRCEIDLSTNDSRVVLSITPHDRVNGILMLFDPDTLERDYDAEATYWEACQEQERKLWIQQIGRERAINMVDAYCGEGGE